MNKKIESSFIIKTTILNRKDEFDLDEIEKEVKDTISTDKKMIKNNLDELVYYGLVYDRGNRYIVKTRSNRRKTDSLEIA